MITVIARSLREKRDEREIKMNEITLIASSLRDRRDEREIKMRTVMAGSLREGGNTGRQ